MFVLARRVAAEDREPEAALRIAAEIGRMVAEMHDAQVRRSAPELFSVALGLHLHTAGIQPPSQSTSSPSPRYFDGLTARIRITEPKICFQ